MRYFLLFITVVLLAGCSITSPSVQSEEVNRQRLQEALLLLQNEKLQEASDRLTLISNEPKIPGVTDEALFHLALLQLCPEPDKAKIQKARTTLRRLQDDFPTSRWAAQGRQLDRLLVKIAARIDEAATIKRDMQKLKKLDMDLERGR
jgi:outer membrane protein assembly factor BamD (BamD/ComL family)